ncbi:MAG: tetratricopeptide repeat protein [Chthoniobacterales bacterium]
MTPARTQLGLALLLGLAAFALYSRSLWSGFVYDAEAQIQYDSYIHTPAHFADVASLRVVGQDVLDGTRPVHLFFLMTDSLVWGRNPFGYHLTSNLLHAFNTALLFLLLARLGAEISPTQSAQRVWMAAAAGTLIFIAHPMLVEPISEVSDREDPLALFFTLAALSFAIHFPCGSQLRTIACGAACVVSAFLAAASKESGFVVPLILALFAWIFRGAKPHRAWGILLAAVFVVVGSFVVARFALPPEVSKIFPQKPQYIGGSLGAVLQLEPRVWVFLFSKVAWPLHLSADYMPQDVAAIFPLHFPAEYTPQTITWILFTCAIAVLAVLLAVQTILSLKSRLALLGTSIFWLGLAPVSNFIPLFRPVADRFFYMPMAGIAATVCAALLLAQRKRFFQIAGGAIFLIAIALGCLAWQRQAVFANPLNLWRDTTANSPNSWTAADNLGYALGDAGDYDGALKAFGRALQLTNEKQPDPWAGAAMILERMGRHGDAGTVLQKAIALDPRYARPQELVEAVTMNPEDAAEIEKILERSRQPAPGQ